MSKNKAIKSVRKYIDTLKQENFPLSAVYIFGSYAKGRAHFGSDIDVAIVSPKLRENWDEVESWLWEKRRGIDALIEPVGYAPEDFTEADPLVSEIKATGIRVL
ncbi:nucleotidyltransferase domain-containing protein [Patescibacteria group bacterium AH-259-L07]|nr:nucleotidyltransferase domain-containing protein [Patescibacteria group bacterium AH-259-L07]